MHRRPPAHRAARRAALAVEGAVVYPAWLLLTLGLVVGGIGVFRYQQVACLAREATRWAAVHGSDWQAENSQPPALQNDILQQAVLPMAVGMDPSAVTVQVQFVNRAAGTVSSWDTVAHPPTATDNAGNVVSNRVRVTVVYQWSPGALLVGPYAITSASEMAMFY